MITSEDLSAIVRSTVAQISPDHGFSDIQPFHTLGILGLNDEAAISELKTRVYRVISSPHIKLDFHKFYNSTALTRNSTLTDVVNAVMSALPGNDPTIP